MQSMSSTNVKGIDVSNNNGTITWGKVANAGVQFTFIKATEGVSYTDSSLDANVKGAQAAGIKVGFYHYAHPELGNSATAEAQYFVSKVKGYTLDLAYVLDVEGAASKLGKANLTVWCKSFADTVASLTNKPVVIYSSASFANTYLGSALSSYPLWVANYGVNTPMADSTWSQWSVFQYADNGTVSGITGEVDLDVMELAFFNQLTGVGTLILKSSSMMSSCAWGGWLMVMFMPPLKRWAMR